MHVEKFIHDNQEFEIRTITDGESVYVKAFRDNKPANHFRYSVTLEVVCNMATVFGSEAVKHLIEIAKQDIVKGLK